MLRKPYRKYFTTRRWGFGSNIVNFLKSSIYCYANDYELIIQDRNNTIGDGYCLFSVIKLQDFIVRTNVLDTIEIDGNKAFIKYILYSKDSAFQKLKISTLYLTGIKKGSFMKNFNMDSRIRSFFNNNYQNYIGNVFLKLWDYTPEIKMTFQELDIKNNFVNYTPDIVLQVRGGDKISERKVQGKSEILINQYVEKVVENMKHFETKQNINMYIMTDTYSYYDELKNILSKLYPQIEVRAMVMPSQSGYVQETFNNIDKESKIDAYKFLLYELEMLRKGTVCIGSYNSNIFYLASVIRYSVDSNFISIDVDFEDTFL